jgi:hypothetical protein
MNGTPARKDAGWKRFHAPEILSEPDRAIQENPWIRKRPDGQAHRRAKKKMIMENDRLLHAGLSILFPVLEKNARWTALA